MSTLVPGSVDTQAPWVMSVVTCLHCLHVSGQHLENFTNPFGAYTPPTALHYSPYLLKRSVDSVDSVDSAVSQEFARLHMCLHIP